MVEEMVEIQKEWNDVEFRRSETTKLDDKILKKRGRYKACNSPKDKRQIDP